MSNITKNPTNPNPPALPESVVDGRGLHPADRPEDSMQPLKDHKPVAAKPVPLNDQGRVEADFSTAELWTPRKLQPQSADVLAALAAESGRAVAVIPRAIVLRCTLTEQCDFHRDGGPEVEKCPGVCDFDGCNRDGEVETSTERSLCEPHAALTVLARALREALAADDAAKGSEHAA